MGVEQCAAQGDGPVPLAVTVMLTRCIPGGSRLGEWPPPRCHYDAQAASNIGTLRYREIYKTSFFSRRSFSKRASSNQVWRGILISRRATTSSISRSTRAGTLSTTVFDPRSFRSAGGCAFLLTAGVLCDALTCGFFTKILIGMYSTNLTPFARVPDIRPVVKSCILRISALSAQTRRTCPRGSRERLPPRR